MNRTSLRLIAGAGIAALALGGGLGLSTAQAATPTIDPALAEALSFMREEERLARDLYAALEAVHGTGTTPFANIKLSEQQHFERVGYLLDRYGLDDPSAGLPAGDFAFAELDELYAELFASGSASLAGAFAAGIAVEKADIVDLTETIELSTDATVDTVLERLRDASESHLAAFERAASGETRVGTGRPRAASVTPASADRRAPGQGNRGRTPPGACLPASRTGAGRREVARVGARETPRDGESYARP